MDKKALDAARAAKEYFIKNGNWDIPDQLVKDGVSIGRWWKNMKCRLLEGNTSDEFVRLIKEEGLDFGFRPLYQKEWYKLSQKYMKKYGIPELRDVYGVYKIGLWYSNFISGYIRDKQWFENLEKFRKIWFSDYIYDEIPYISKQTPWGWICQQKNAKNMPYYKVLALEELDIPWSEPLKIEATIRKKIKNRAEQLLEARLQEIIDEESLDGISQIETLGLYLIGRKCDENNTYFRCDVSINSLFTEKQYLEYVDKMKNQIYKETKKKFVQSQKINGKPVLAKNVKLYRMVSNRKIHVLTIIFKVQGKYVFQNEDENKEEF